MSRFGCVTPSEGLDVTDRKACFLSLLAQAPVWLYELRVSRHFSTFYGSSVQAMDTQLGARQRRRTPTTYQSSAQRTISTGSWFGQGVKAAIRMPGRDRELQIMGRLRVFLTFVLAISRRMVSECPPEPGISFELPGVGRQPESHMGVDHERALGRVGGGISLDPAQADGHRSSLWS